MKVHSLEVRGAQSLPTYCAFFLHGILGSAKNWRTFARRFVEAHPAWVVHLVDLRNHGSSPHALGENTLIDCAGDLVDLARRLGVSPEAVCGHSFGGKVALQYAAIAETPPRHVWVLDSNPGAAGTEPHRISGGHVLRVIEHLASVDQPLASRSALAEQLASAGFSASLAAWMTTNLRPTSSGYVWRFSLQGACEMLEDYARCDFFEELEGGRIPGRVTVVRAESTHWPDHDLNRLRGIESRHADRFRYQVLPRSGHWVHVDNPGGVLEILKESLTSWGSPAG